MWTRTYSKTLQGLKREEVWALWCDVNNWPAWQSDLDYCKLEGDFKVGNHFFLKPKGVNPVKIELTEIKEGHSFTDCTSFFGAKMYDIHAMEETSEGLKLTSTIIVTGPLKWLWVKIVAQNVANSLPGQTEALIQMAKKQNV